VEAYRVGLSSFPSSVHNPLTDGGQVVSLMRPPQSSSTHFCVRLSEPQGLVRLEGFGKFTKLNDIGTRTRDFSVFRIVLQSLIQPRAPNLLGNPS
jgi:hypothetical protein